ncbi:MAG: hypothetical protein DMF61_23430 [Blastocatellia bacterium AA13]|nr:MAG: hypothetical protein DMF61_23430 [Blastocatellia bacterium AA13]
MDDWTRSAKAKPIAIPEKQGTSDHLLSGNKTLAVTPGETRGTRDNWHRGVEEDGPVENTRGTREDWTRGVKTQSGKGGRSKSKLVPAANSSIRKASERRENDRRPGSKGGGMR